MLLRAQDRQTKRTRFGRSAGGWGVLFGTGGARRRGSPQGCRLAASNSLGVAGGGLGADGSEWEVEEGG